MGGLENPIHLTFLLALLLLVFGAKRLPEMGRSLGSGLRGFREAGAMGHEEWGGRFEPKDLDGRPLAQEELPLSIALSDARPAHRPMRIRSAHAENHDIEVTAFPVVGRGGQAGAIAIFWERPR